MNNKTRQDIVDIIDSRFISATNCLTDRLIGELEIAIDLAGLTGAIEMGQQRHYKERLNRIVANDKQQWADSNRRLA
ncbi:hypothetical protein [Pseudomonas putida]|uniref:Uncharacterized protein n=1 Tax=Pseudomonas putida TaxID=303 RepID=A0A6S5U2X8_PSEPU|nr:hypothetical protein [Pseudomonas putida]BBT40919.1 hypothetical protein WP8W18C01_32600 [Pseudomonas putida]